MKAKLLLVEDDEKLSRLLGEFLSRQDYECVPAYDGEEGLSRLRTQEGYDLVILDWMLPKLDGLELLKRLRAAGSTLPVIMLTARAEVADRVVGLSLGADDYLPKPFEPRELSARVEALLRRTHGKLGAETLSSGELKIDTSRRQAWIKEQPLGLTTLEFDLLELFLRRRGRVLSRDAISAAVKGFEHEALDRSIDVAISRLREKLADDPRKPKFLKTVWGKGYQWLEA